MTITASYTLSTPAAAVSVQGDAQSANAVDFQLVSRATAENPDEGDIEISGTEFVMVEGRDAVVQEIKVRLSWWRGEWFLDLSRGTPYLEELLGKGVSNDTVRTVLRKEIEAVPGVQSLRSIAVTADRAARYTTVDPEILLDDGEIAALQGIPLASLAGT